MVEREAVHAGPERQHHHRHWPVDRVARRDLRRARLQEVLPLGLLDALGAAQHREEIVPTGALTSMLGAPSSGGEQEQVASARIARGDLVGIDHVLGDDAGELATPFAGPRP